MTLKEYIEKYHGGSVKNFVEFAKTLGVDFAYSTAFSYANGLRVPRKKEAFERIKVSTKGKVKPSSFYE